MVCLGRQQSDSCKGSGICHLGSGSGGPVGMYEHCLWAWSHVDDRSAHAR